MKGIAVKCPECHAPLDAGADTQEIRCSYCGTLTVIQRRTRILQRPVPLPPRSPDAPAAQVVTEKSQGWIWIVFLLIVVGLPVGIPVVLCNLDWSKPQGRAVLVDVNGDKTMDLVVLMRDRDSEALTLAAFQHFRT